MPVGLSFTSPSRRRQGRVNVNLPCRVQSQDMEVSATVNDLSLGGAGISLKYGSHGFDSENTRHIVIEDIGAFDVIFRWKSSTRIGVSFKSQEYARQRIGTYFEDNNIVPPDPQSFEMPRE